MKEIILEIIILWRVFWNLIEFFVVTRNSFKSSMDVAQAMLYQRRL